MNFSLHIKRLLKACLCLFSPSHKFLRKISRVSTSLSNGTLAIDVGASYFPHGPWECLRHSPCNCWIAVDPNSGNLNYLQSWNYLFKSNLISIPMGLASHDGKHTLYITNVDSGSSLLEPLINNDWRHRVPGAYFFPIRSKSVECLTLSTVLRDYANAYSQSPIWIKLDTQGTELSILKGLDEKAYLENVILVESETTLQLKPIMQGAGKLDGLIAFLEPLGFELVSLKPIMAPVPATRFGMPSSSGILNECDAVYILSPSYALTHRPLQHNLSLISAYLSYSLYYEAAQHARRVLHRFSLELDDVRIELLSQILAIFRPS